MMPLSVVKLLLKERESRTHKRSELIQQHCSLTASKADKGLRVTHSMATKEATKKKAGGFTKEERNKRQLNTPPVVCNASSTRSKREVLNYMSFVALHHSRLSWVENLPRGENPHLSSSSENEKGGLNFNRKFTKALGKVKITKHGSVVMQR